MLGGPIKTNPIPNLTIEQVNRFWSKVDKSGGPDACWNWLKGKDKNGYGKCCIGSRHLKSHRITYFIWYRKQPLELQVCHTCDNPSCCNPGHLWLGTHKENHLDCDIKRRRQYGIGHHKTFFSENEIIDILLSTETQIELAKRYNTNATTINNIKRRITWKHVRPDILPSMIKPHIK